MSGSTAVQGYPYPLTSDFADVQDAFRLVLSIDEDLRDGQAPFRAFIGRPSFIARQTVTGSGFTSGTQTFTVGAIDWDNTGGLVVGVNSWSQPNNEAPSWWLFGATILVNPTGAAVVGDMNMARISVSTTDPATDIVTTTRHYQRNDDTNTGGEWLNVFTMAPIYQGTVSGALILSGSTQKAILAGSRLWGMRMGPVV